MFQTIDIKAYRGLKNITLQNLSRVNILADSIELLGSRSSSSQNNGNSDSFGGYQQRASYSQNQSSGGGYEPSSEAFGGDNAGFPEDIPF